MYRNSRHHTLCNPPSPLSLSSQMVHPPHLTRSSPTSPPSFSLTPRMTDDNIYTPYHPSLRPRTLSSLNTRSRILFHRLQFRRTPYSRSRNAHPHSPPSTPRYPRSSFPLPLLPFAYPLGSYVIWRRSVSRHVLADLAGIAC